MMSDEERVLSAEEWRCVRIGLDSIYETLRTSAGEETEILTGITVFDNLTTAQKYAQLASVCAAMNDPSVPAPPLTAVNEGTVAALLQTFYSELEAEIDLSEDDVMPWLECRRALLDALTSDPWLDEDLALPSEDEDDTENWEFPMQILQSRFLTDEDYLMSELLDLPRDNADELKDTMGIDSDYFVAVAPEPTPGELIGLHQVLCRLLQLPCTDADGKYPALFDRYSGLLVGPCTQDEIDNWSHNYWIEVRAIETANWDCEFAVWKTNFTRALLDAAPSAEASENFAKQQAARRDAALISIGIPF